MPTTRERQLTSSHHHALKVGRDGEPLVSIFPPMLLERSKLDQSNETPQRAITHIRVVCSMDVVGD